MATTTTERILSDEKEFRALDNYLGFCIYSWQDHDVFYATAQDFAGPVLSEDSLPKLRRRIWRWWHQVELA